MKGGVQSRLPAKSCNSEVQKSLSNLPKPTVVFMTPHNQKNESLLPVV